MDAIIRKQFNMYSTLINHDVFNEIAIRTRNSDTGKSPYFFFKSELDVPRVLGGKVSENVAKYAELKKTSIRHLIPHKKGYFDYIVRKEYPTLEEWATQNGKTVNDICYGRLDVHFLEEFYKPEHAYWYEPRMAYITLNQLLKSIDSSWDPVQTVDIAVLEEPIDPAIQTTLDRVNALMDIVKSLNKSVKDLHDVLAV